MKFNIKEITRENTLLSHMILSSVNDAAIATLPEGRTGDTEMDIELKLNGVEIDIRKFIQKLESSWETSIKAECRPEAYKLFEEMKHEFKSKNSTNAQLNKIREQLQKATNQLKNITENVNRIDSL